jgi:predicted RNA-binding Zn-ribbon protein involved in translation (DUF1610 family)
MNLSRFKKKPKKLKYHDCEGIKAGKSHVAWYCPICDMIIRVENWRSQANRGEGVPRFPFVAEIEYAKSKEKIIHRITWFAVDFDKIVSEALGVEENKKPKLMLIRDGEVK